jgi:hypothetical protein
MCATSVVTARTSLSLLGPPPQDVNGEFCVGECFPNPRLHQMSRGRFSPHLRPRAGNNPRGVPRIRVSSYQFMWCQLFICSWIHINGIQTKFLLQRFTFETEKVKDYGFNFAYISQLLDLPSIWAFRVGSPQGAGTGACIPSLAPWTSMGQL